MAHCDFLLVVRLGRPMSYSSMSEHTLCTII